MVKIQTRGGGGVLGILLLFAAIATFIFVINPTTVCERPLAYDIGIVDDEFGITKDSFLSTIVQAENIWEGGMGMELFTYKPDAEFKINLIFDERQRKTLAERRAREVLEGNGASYDSLHERYDSLISQHNKKLEQYNASLTIYEKDLSKYNSEVEHYNKIGGAPEKKFNELERKRAEMENTVVLLDNRRGELDKLNDQINSLVEKINNLAGEYNTDVAKYNQAFGTATTFDQGEYTGDKINIYQFDEESDLRLVLVHEFGHALNLDHVENPKSIMYYLMEEQSLREPELSKEDMAALAAECGL